MKLLVVITIICLISSTLATYGLYAVVPSYVAGYAYPRAPAAYRYAVPVGYTYSAPAPATTTFVKYVEPETYDYPVYALAIDPDLKK